MNGVVNPMGCAHGLKLMDVLKDAISHRITACLVQASVCFLAG